MKFEVYALISSLNADIKNDTNLSRFYTFIEEDKYIRFQWVKKVVFHQTSVFLKKFFPNFKVFGRYIKYLTDAYPKLKYCEGQGKKLNKDSYKFHRLGKYQNWIIMCISACKPSSKNK